MRSNQGEDGRAHDAAEEAGERGILDSPGRLGDAGMLMRGGEGSMLCPLACWTLGSLRACSPPCSGTTRCSLPGWKSSTHPLYKRRDVCDSAMGSGDEMLRFLLASAGLPSSATLHACDPCHAFFFVPTAAGVWTSVPHPDGGEGGEGKPLLAAAPAGSCAGEATSLGAQGTPQMLPPMHSRGMSS